MDYSTLDRMRGLIVPNSWRQRLMSLLAAILIFGVGHLVLMYVPWHAIGFLPLVLWVLFFPAMTIFCVLCAIDVRDPIGDTFYGTLLGLFGNALYLATVAEYGFALLFTFLGTVFGFFTGCVRRYQVLLAEGRIANSGG